MAIALKFLRRLQDDHLSQRSLIELLDKRLAGMEPARSHHILHVSTVTDDERGFCPRQYALLDVLEQKLPAKFVRAAERVAYDNGNALHDLCRNKWLRNDVIGCWKCKTCKEVRHFSKLPALKSKDEHLHDWQYEEEVFTDPGTGTQGSIDFFVDLGNGKLTIVEAKSIDKDQFATLAGPMGKHRLRTQMYLALIDRSASQAVKDQIDLTHGRILYISKGYGKKHAEFGKVLPLKEFSVTRNDEALIPYFEKGHQLHHFRNGGPLPALVCESHQDKRATNCPVCKQCFSGKYPAGITL